MWRAYRNVSNALGKFFCGLHTIDDLAIGHHAREPTDIWNVMEHSGHHVRMCFYKAGSENFVLEAPIDVCDSPRLAFFKRAHTQNLAIAYGNCSARWARGISRANKSSGIDDVGCRR